MLSAIQCVDYTVLLCNDLDRMRLFYCDVMGFAAHLETPSWIEFRLGSTILALSRRDRPWVGDAISADTAGVQLAFKVHPDEVASCHAELLTHDVEIVQPPQDMPEHLRQYWQHRTLFFKDPEGNLLEIYAEIGAYFNLSPREEGA